MKLGPIEIIWNTQTTYRQRLRAIVREALSDMLSNDIGLRAIIARCARSEAKDYLADLAESRLAEIESDNADLAASRLAELESDPSMLAAEYRFRLPSPLTPEQKAVVIEYLDHITVSDVPLDHLEQSRLDLPSPLYRLPTEDELAAGIHEVQPTEEGTES